MKLFHNLLTVVCSPTVVLCAAFFSAVPTNAANLVSTNTSTTAAYPIKLQDTNNNSVQNGGLKKLINNIKLAQTTTTVQTVFTTQVPSGSANDRSYELGMKFRTTTAGQITTIRYWKPAGETGTHTGRIWSATGTLLASVTFTNETASGWQQQALSTPLNIQANTTYVVSVNANSYYPYTFYQLASSIVNGNLSSVADSNNGVYNTTPGNFPTNSYQNSNYFRDVSFVATSQTTSTPTTSWKERILNADGTINWTEYTNVANNYHKREMIDYRFGPKYSDFHATEEAFPTVYQPSPDGIIRVNAGSWCRVNPGTDGDPGLGWQMSGQMIFSPDPGAPADYQYGSSNMRSSDGAIRTTDLGKCLRIRAEWLADWWNRNNISTPATPTVRQAYQASGGTLPLPPIATARGVGGASVTGFLAFQNGLVGSAGTGNDPYVWDGISNSSTMLGPGKIPTAMAVTNNNEFVLVTVWDTVNRKGQLAVLAVKNRQNAQEQRFYWGLPGWPIIQGIKVIGYIDLPFAAPNAIDVTVSTKLGNTRGFNDNVNDDFNIQSVRDNWYNTPWDTWYGNNYWKQTAQSGYAIVSSRAENKVAFIDLRPLLKYYRKMYLTTQANFDQTKNEGTAANQWPYTFTHAPEQIPVVSKVLTINQPTAVATGNRWNGFKAPRSEYNKEVQKPLRTAYIASMDGTVRMYNVESLILPNAAQSIPETPFKSFQVGRNPVQMFHGFHSTSSDDYYIVSRGDRSIYYTYYDGKVNAVLRDSRLKDPVNAVVSYDALGGYMTTGMGLYSYVMTVMDFSGKQVVNYMVDDGVNWFGEQVKFLGPNGEKMIFQHGYSNPVNGNPFMFTLDEVI